MTRLIWCFIREDGSVLADSTWESEEDAWQVGLGWPSGADIEHAKRLGYRVEQRELSPRREDLFKEAE